MERSKLEKIIDPELYKTLMKRNPELLREIEKEDPVLVLSDWGYIVEALVTIFLIMILGIPVVTFLLEQSYIFHAQVIIITSLLLFFFSGKRIIFKEIPWLVLKSDGNFVYYSIKQQKVSLSSNYCYGILAKRYIDVFFLRPVETSKIWIFLIKKEAPNLFLLCLLFLFPFLISISVSRTVSMFMLKIFICRKIKTESSEILYLYFSSKESTKLSSPKIVFLNRNQRSILLKHTKCKIVS